MTYHILQVTLHPQLVQKQRNPPRRSLPSRILPLPVGGQLARRMLQPAAAGLRLRAARSQAHLRRSQKPTSLCRGDSLAILSAHTALHVLSMLLPFAHKWETK